MHHIKIYQGNKLSEKEVNQESFSIFLDVVMYEENYALGDRIGNIRITINVKYNKIK